MAAPDTHVEEERDAIVLYLRKRELAWAVLSDPVSPVVAGELSDISDEIEAGRHWVAEE